MDQDDIEIERLFNSCDRNGDGAIDINEIAKIMKMMNNDKEPPELEGNIKLFTYFSIKNNI